MWNTMIDEVFYGNGLLAGSRLLVAGGFWQVAVNRY
jgi:hypothetical protein